MRKQKISKIEEKKFFKFLYKIGYFPQKQISLKKRNLVKSFQRHFRQRLINGIIDKECLFIAKELVNIK